MREALEGTVGCGRVVAAGLAAAAVLTAASACATTEQMNTAPQSSASTAAASSPAKTAEEAALGRLRAWLAAPRAGELSYNTVQITDGGTTNVMSILSGTFDPALGQSTLTGSVRTLGSGPTTQGPSSAIESGAKVYTSIPDELQTGDRIGKEWEVAPVRATWAAGAAHSGWWTALDAVQSLTSDGVTSLDGTTVDMYSDTLDLAKVKGIPKQLLESDPVVKAGTKVEVDVYTQMGSGALVRVTYKLGLPVQIDAAATPHSSAGYQVDLSGLGQVGSASTAPAAPSTGPAFTVPEPETVAVDTGDEDLAALLPF